MTVNSKQLTVNSLAFTLIELLVVVSIIGILAALSMVSFSTAQKQARDTQRKSDLKQYQTALEAFANKQSSGLFPSRTTKVDPSTLCSTLGISNSCPQDPKTPTHDYSYISDGSGSLNTDATQYILWAYLEGSSNYFTVCSTGKTGTSISAPSSLPCPI